MYQTHNRELTHAADLQVAALNLGTVEDNPRITTKKYEVTAISSDFVDRDDQASANETGATEHMNITVGELA